MTHQPISKTTTDIVPVIQRQLAPVVDQALAITLKTAKDLPPAVELLSKLNQINDKIKAEKERITKPLLEALNVERSRWKPMELANTEAIETIRTKLSDYQTAEMAKQKAKEAKITEQLKEGEIDLDKAVEKMERVKTPDKEVATAQGLVQFRETQVLKIWDHTMIPREYLLPDDKAILAALKAGKKVEGCEIEIVMTPVNYR